MAGDGAIESCLGVTVMAMGRTVRGYKLMFRLRMVDEILLHLYISAWRMDSLNNTESFNQVLFRFLISPSNILCFFRVSLALCG